MRVEEKNSVGEHMVIRDLASLISLVQFGALELHTWGCHADDIETPDRLIFDLDAAPEVEFSRVIKCAEVLRAGLEALGLISFVKTSGKKGLHICLPLERKHTWDEVKSFAHAIADHMVELASNEYIARIPKKERTNKILIDYLRNERGATCVSAYSTRATTNGNISVPLDWDELKGLKSADQFTLLTIDKRLKQVNDPWKDYFKIKQSLKNNPFMKKQ